MTAPNGLTRTDKGLALGCGLVVVLLAVDVIVNGPFSQLDDVFRDRLPFPRDDPPRWLDWLADLGGLGLSAVVLGVASIPYSQLIWRFWPVVLAAATWSTTGLLVLVAKLVVGRPGPGIGDVAGYPGFYPSGHTATSAATAGTVALIILTARRPAWSPDRQTGACVAAALLIGGLTGVFAVWGDHHWVTDVVGGLLLPVPVLVVAAHLTRRHVRRTAPTGHAP